MSDIFITLEEAAAFEGVGYEAMKKRVQRSPKEYNLKTQAREGGGKDQVLISVSSLSAKARKAYRAAQKVDGRDVIIDQRAKATPWYVEADLNHYIEGNKKRLYEAVELAARVQDFIDYAAPATQNATPWGWASARRRFTAICRMCWRPTPGR